MAAYATVADLVSRFDEGTLRDLCSDIGIPEADLETSPKMTAALEAASGQVEAACLVSGNYTALGLAALTGNPLALLKELVCTLAMVKLMRRRPEKFGSEVITAMLKETEMYLDQLRGGGRLFADGSHDDVESGSPKTDGATITTIEINRAITSRVRGFYPRPETRLPADKLGGS